MEIIKKKVGNIEFVWDPNSYQGQGGWYKILKGRKNKPDGYGRSANAKERKILGIPVSADVNEESSEDDEDFDPNTRSREYREARRTSLLGLIQENFEEGKGFGESLKQGLSDLAKYKAISFKEKLDPLNIANNIAGPFASLALGRALGRTDEDIRYFSGISRSRRRMASKVKEETELPNKKIGNLDTALYSSISENQQRRFRKGDGTATLLARMLNLMKKYHEEDLQYQEKEYKRELASEEQRENFNKRMSTLMKVSGASAGASGSDTGSEGPPTSNLGYLGGLLKAFLIGKAGRLIISKILKTRFGKALIKTKIGRFLAKSSLKLLRPFKGSPLNVIKNISNVPGKTISRIAKFLTPSAKVGDAAKGAATASKVAAAADKPGFLKTAEEKIAERGARQAAEKKAAESVKATAKAGAATTKQTMKGVEAAGTAAGKVVGKKIPVLGAILGAGFAIERALEGDYLGASGELASGLLSTVPLVGTAASLAIDGALMARDLSKEEQTASPITSEDAQAPNQSAAETARLSAKDRPMPPRTGPKGEPSVTDSKGRTGYMKRTGRYTTFVPFETTPEPPKVAPVPPEPNQNTVRLQEAIKTNEEGKLNSKSPMKPVIMQENKTMNTGTNAPDFIDYGGDFNIRETDPTLFWVLKSNLRPI